MVELGTRNSRRRDYFDIHALCLYGSFAGDVLRRTIEATFARRRTAIPTELPVGLTGAFAETEGKAAQRNGLLQRLMQDKAPIDLSSVVESLARFFGPVLIAAGQGPACPRYRMTKPIARDRIYRKRHFDADIILLASTARLTTSRHLLRALSLNTTSTAIPDAIMGLLASRPNAGKL